MARRLAVPQRAIRLIGTEARSARGPSGRDVAAMVAINGALSAATTSAAFLSALQANESVILELQSTAPSKIVNAAGTLTEATRRAIQSSDIAVFNTKTVARAAIAVDKFCGQKS